MASINSNGLSKALREIVWQFGPKGLDGECCENLSMPEFIALEKAANTQHCAVQDIGRQLGFTKSGATRIVNRLEKKGYIQKVTSHEDARVCCVVPTKSGKAVLSSTGRRYDDQLNALLSKMDADTAKKVADSLSEMARALRK